MADDSQQGTAGNGAAQTPSSEPEFSLQAVYLKDSSFEAPKGPRFEGNWNPQISLDLNTQAEELTPETREVVLTVSVSAKIGEVTVFLVEVKQAGLFGVSNLSGDDYRRAIASIAPGVLFPYARAAISQLVSLGGFPQLLLPPVNFDALLARSRSEAQTASAARN